MDRKVPISDAAISRSVIQHLAGRGLRSPCRITVQTRNGEVTLSGTVQYVHQRDAAVQAIRTVEGIKRVVEKLKVTPAAKHHYQQAAGPLSKPPAVDAGQGEAAEATVEATQGESDETTTPAPPDAPHQPHPLLGDLPASDRLSTASESTASESTASESTASESTDFSTSGNVTQLTPHVTVTTPDMRHSRKGDSYTFECANREEAARLRVLLATYADWLKKNSWVGESKPDSGAHRVTFHAKSVIEFLRQQDF